MRALVRHLTFPIALAAGLLAARALLARGAPPEAVIAIWFAAMPCVAVLERALPRHAEWNRPHGDLATDAIYLPATLLVAGSLQAAYGVAHLALARGLQATFSVPLWPEHAPLAAQVALACVLGELFAYWAHRLMHEVPFLWRFHAVHHSAPRVYWLNAARAHPGEHLFRGFVSSLPLGVIALVGASPEVLAYWMVTSRIAGLFQHANIDFALGPFAWIFSIGELHRWHHAADRSLANHNYGDTFIFWDAVFGTRHLPRGEPAPVEVGIRGLEAFPRGFFAQQLAPFRWRAIERASAAAGRSG